jgi:CheY-like chemotaxis protein
MQVGGSLTVETANVTLAEAPRRPEEPGPGDYVVIAVRDTGVGMSEEVLAKAFEPFFTTKEVGKGSGLGLAQVYGFAKQSGGGVRVETAPGRGTTVSVFLPRAAGTQPEDAAAGAADPVADGGGTGTILLVDDDAAVREVTSGLLRDFGYGVLEAGSGGAALEILADGANVDLLLIDFAMPGMNGAEVVREARIRRPALPVLFLTGYADFAALRNFDEAHVVQKPFGGDDLARRIRTAMAAAPRSGAERPQSVRPG